MGLIASFDYVKTSDVPFLGFWSMPKRRLFRSPLVEFDKRLAEHALKSLVFSQTDGVYVALVFAWLETCTPVLKREADPVIETLRRRLKGSYWLLQHDDRAIVEALQKAMEPREWDAFLRQLKEGADLGWSLDSYSDARLYLRDRIMEVTPMTALLVSVG
ncbi:MAG TPA: hypothetical protein VD994_14030 [Prosthecobacter sp.]|nr:hypothetical protein [Prosthecobacter sp.]